MAEWANGWAIFLLSLQVLEILLVPYMVGRERTTITQAGGVGLACWSLFITFCMLKAFGAI